MGRLIVIVDDEPDILELVSLHLKKTGFAVKGFEDADTFYHFIETHSPDLIILDLMLPDIDGLEICKYLKRKENTTLGHISTTSFSSSRRLTKNLKIASGG